MFATCSLRFCRCAAAGRSETGVRRRAGRAAPTIAQTGRPPTRRQFAVFPYICARRGPVIVGATMSIVNRNISEELCQKIVKARQLLLVGLSRRKYLIP